MKSPLNILKEKVVQEYKEYHAPEDFHCGGCLECEGCHHYFLGGFVDTLSTAIDSAYKAGQGDVILRINRSKKV